jgi:hypothetical protein
MSTNETLEYKAVHFQDSFHYGRCVVNLTPNKFIHDNVINT